MRVLSGVQRRHLGEFTLLAGSTALFQVSRLGIGFVAAAVLSPAEYGTWGLVLAWLSYSVYANFGVLSGANREIPRLIGAGLGDDATRVERTALGATLVVAGATLVGGSLVLTMLSPNEPGVLIAAVVAVAVQQLYLFYQMSLRSRLDFRPASLQQTMIALVFPAVSVPLLLRIGVASLVVGQVAAFAFGAFVVWALWRRPLRPTLEPHLVRRLVVYGAPIMLGGFLFALFTTMDRWLTLWLIGDAALGRYTLAGLIASALLLVSLVVTQQLYPRMAMSFGRYGSASAIWPFAVQQSLAVFLVLLLPVLLIAAILPAVIPVLLPTYRESASAIAVLPFGFLVLTSGSGFMNLLVTIGRSHIYIICLLLGIAVETVVAILLVDAGAGLAAIAFAASAGFAAATVSSAVAAYMVSR